MKDLNSLLAISPIDGRYRKHAEALSYYCSEFALIRYRVRVEIEWFILLVTDAFPELQPSNPGLFNQVNRIWQDFDVEDATKIREIEATTNHDVKSVEYFVKDAVSALGLTELKEFVHFGCTSEDINNLAYALMLKDSREKAISVSMRKLITELLQLAESHADQPMLSRTHGQVASPTTLGKELINLTTRLHEWMTEFEGISIYGKMNGAVGNFNAHVVAAPEVDWQNLASKLIKSLEIEENFFTTQIEPHDWIAKYLNAISGFNQVLLDLDRDIWSYISIGYFKQRQVQGEVGSSTMPHKVNPIDFENSEGNVGIANATAQHLANKLLISRWQRDLSDSTALRNLGVVLAHTEIAIRSTVRGLSKLDVNTEVLASDLNESWEVLAEPVQTVLRRSGTEDPYETLKVATRGESLSAQNYQELLKQLPLDDTSRATLSTLTPATYIGKAAELTRLAVKKLSSTLNQ